MTGKGLFALADRNLTSANLRDFVPDAVVKISEQSGALVEFCGIVRDHNEGKSVISLEYSAYAELALKEGKLIVEAAFDRFEIDGAVCVHRTGKLSISDVAIVTRVWAAHRGRAFDACRWIVDEVKERVPIWKHEHYADSPAAWVNAEPGTSPTVSGEPLTS